MKNTTAAHTGDLLSLDDPASVVGGIEPVKIIRYYPYRRARVHDGLVIFSVGGLMEGQSARAARLHEQLVTLYNTSIPEFLRHNRYLRVGQGNHTCWHFLDQKGREWFVWFHDCKAIFGTGIANDDDDQVEEKDKMVSFNGWSVDFFQTESGNLGMTVHGPGSSPWFENSPCKDVFVNHKDIEILGYDAAA